jgi:hypothetical protein
VTSWRPRGNGIGSSKSRFQPLPLMTPALFVELHLEPFPHPRIVVLARVAPWTRSAGAATGARVLAFPRSIRVGFTNPAAVLAQAAFHCSPLLPRIILTTDLAMPRGPTGSGQAWRVLGTPSRVGPPITALLQRSEIVRTAVSVFNRAKADSEGLASFGTMSDEPRLTASLPRSLFRLANNPAAKVS